MSPIGPGRGHFETMEVQGDVWHLSGWICHPDEVATSVAALADGVLIAEAEPTMRVDVVGLFRSPGSPSPSAPGIADQGRGTAIGANGSWSRFGAAQRVLASICWSRGCPMLEQDPW